MPALAAHRDVNAIVDATGDAELAAEIDKFASETIKRVRHGAAATSYDAAVADALSRLESSTSSKRPGTPSAPSRTQGTVPSVRSVQRAFEAQDAAQDRQG